MCLCVIVCVNVCVCVCVCVCAYVYAYIRISPLSVISIKPADTLYVVLSLSHSSPLSVSITFQLLYWLDKTSFVKPKYLTILYHPLSFSPSLSLSSLSLPQALSLSPQSKASLCLGDHGQTPIINQRARLPSCRG